VPIQVWYRKEFFFEKKNQKTFATSVRSLALTLVSDSEPNICKSFLVLFFKKERPAYLARWDGFKIAWYI